MKKVLLGILLFSGAQLFAQNGVQFATTKHSFGKIVEHKSVTYEFAFKNNGSKPLIIESATAECGCTTPEYTKEPIQKGKESKIKVTYTAPTVGAFTKGVQVKFAGSDLPIHLEINGEVIADKKTSKP